MLNPTFATLALALLMPAACLRAELITSVSSVVSNSLGEWSVAGNGITNAINQSGLSQTYVSGVTDLSVYSTQSPTHQSLIGSTFFVSNGGTPFGNIDFDLGNTLNIKSLLLWQATRFPPEQVRNFTVFSSTDVNFSTTTNVGSFTASANAFNSAAPLQRFDLVDTNARFVRLQIQSNYGSSFTDIGELAFGTTAVPEPSSLILIGLATTIGAVRHRKKLIKRSSHLN
jgi:hypothetical protein